MSVNFWEDGDVGPAEAKALVVGIGARLRAAREAAGLTQAELAKAVTLHGSSLTKEELADLEAGQLAPGSVTAVLLDRLSRQLGPSMLELLTGDGRSEAERWRAGEADCLSCGTPVKDWSAKALVCASCGYEPYVPTDSRVPRDCGTPPRRSTGHG